MEWRGSCVLANFMRRVQIKLTLMHRSVKLLLLDPSARLLRFK
jgi:hypothetical protein